MNVYFSIIFLILLVILAISLVLGVGNVLIGATIDTTKVDEAETALRFLNNAIKEVAQEGEGATRVLKLTLPDEIEVIPDEDSVQYKIITPAELFEHLSRKTDGNL